MYTSEQLQVLWRPNFRPRSLC